MIRIQKSFLYVTFCPLFTLFLTPCSHGLSETAVKVIALGSGVATGAASTYATHYVIEQILASPLRAGNRGTLGTCKPFIMAGVGVGTGTLTSLLVYHILKDFTPSAKYQKALAEIHAIERYSLLHRSANRDDRHDQPSAQFPAIYFVKEAQVPSAQQMRSSLTDACKLLLECINEIRLDVSKQQLLRDSEQLLHYARELSCACLYEQAVQKTDLIVQDGLPVRYFQSRDDCMGYLATRFSSSYFLVLARQKLIELRQHLTSAQSFLRACLEEARVYNARKKISLDSEHLLNYSAELMAKTESLTNALIQDPDYQTHLRLYEHYQEMERARQHERELQAARLAQLERERQQERELEMARMAHESHENWNRRQARAQEKDKDRNLKKSCADRADRHNVNVDVHI